MIVTDTNYKVLGISEECLAGPAALLNLLFIFLLVEIFAYSNISDVVLKIVVYVLWARKPVKGEDSLSKRYDDRCNN